MKYKIRVYDIWEFGKRKDAEGKPHQEDNIFPEFGKSTDSDRLFILCDGMGGHDAGEVASATVCQAMSESILKSQPNQEGGFSSDDLNKALTAAYDALDRKDNGSPKKMGTTMTLLKLFDKGACIAHIGDSRVYQIRPGKSAEDTKIIFRTEDHSLVNDLIKVGELTEEEAKNYPRKNVITRAMQPGLDPRPKADVKWISDIQPGDFFYMCSDGMLEEMTDRQICFHFSQAGGDPQTKVSNLIKATLENRDNHTAIIVQVVDVTDVQKSVTVTPENTGSDAVEEMVMAEVTPAPKNMKPKPATPDTGKKVTTPQPVKTDKDAPKKGNGRLIALLLTIAILCGGAYCIFNREKENSGLDEVKVKLDDNIRKAKDHTPKNGHSKIERDLKKERKIIVKKDKNEKTTKEQGQSKKETKKVDKKEQKDVKVETQPTAKPETQAPAASNAVDEAKKLTTSESPASKSKEETKGVVKSDETK